MIKASDYFNRETGRLIDNANKLTFEKECENDSRAFLEKLNSFGASYSGIPILDIPKEISVKVSTTNSEELYGDRTIIYDIDRFFECTNCNQNIRFRLLELRELTEGLLYSRTSRKNPDVSLNRIKKITNYLNKIYSGLCSGCQHDCRKLLEQILSKAPTKQTLLGQFGYYNREITLFSGSIANATSSEEEFNNQFFATLAHETFHYYHYLLCEKFKHGHWNDIITRYPSLTRGRDVRDDNEDPFSINGAISSDDKIVKESLADFFKYYTIFRLSGFDTIAESFKQEWQNNNIYTWPYSGAKVFLPENMDFFVKVLGTSLKDWEEAKDLIIEEYYD